MWSCTYTHTVYFNSCAQTLISSQSRPVSMWLGGRGVCFLLLLVIFNWQVCWELCTLYCLERLFGHHLSNYNHKLHLLGAIFKGDWQAGDGISGLHYWYNLSLLSLNWQSSISINRMTSSSTPTVQ